jgi:hypothetical protein
VVEDSESITVLLLKLAWIGVFFAFPKAGSASAKNSSCESGLTETRAEHGLLVKRLSSTLVKGLPSGGFELRDSAWTSDRNPGKDVEVWLQALRFNRSHWRNEEWIYDGAHYSFLDVGTKNLELDSREIHRLVLEHIRKFPDAKITVNFGAQLNDDLKKLMQLRWATHDEVLEVYKSSKSYLGWADFAILKHVNRISANSDVFTLLRYDSKHAKWSDLTEADIQERLVSTAQISYSGDAVAMTPTPKTLIGHVGGPYADRSAIRKFPFEYRVDLSQARQIHDDLNNVFDISTTCEVTRFVNKVARLPRPVMHRLLFEVFDVILRRGMKVILASLDDKTFRLFKREYGFQKLYEFPVKGNSQHETLAFLFVGTHAFNETYAKLFEGAKRVEVRRIHGE